MTVRVFGVLDDVKRLCEISCHETLVDTGIVSHRTTATGGAENTQQNPQSVLSKEGR